LLPVFPISTSCKKEQLLLIVKRKVTTSTKSFAMLAHWVALIIAVFVDAVAARPAILYPCKYLGRFAKSNKSFDCELQN
jgi:hypothetical protein